MNKAQPTESHSAGRSCAIQNKARAGSNAVGYHAALSRAAKLSVMPVAYSTADVQVDVTGGVIKNAAVMTIGPAKGHGFDIDVTTLQQVADHINTNPAGVKCRLRHPKPEGDNGQSEDDITILVGRVCNASLAGNSVRGDVYLEDYAAIVPGMGDVRAYLLSIAEKNPTHIGLSAVIEFDVDPQLDANGDPVSLPARVFDVQAVDFTGNPAANHAGLLSARTPTAGKVPVSKTKTALRTTNMNMKKLKSILRGLGLADGASDEQAESFLAGLQEDQRTDVLAKLEAGDDDENANLNEGGEEGASSLRARGNSTTPLVQQNNEQAQLAAMTTRIANLRTLGKVMGVDTIIVDEAIAADDTLKAAKTRFLKAIAKKNNAIQPVMVGENRTIGMLKVVVPAALHLRSGIAIDRVKKGNFDGNADADSLMGEAHKLSVHALTEMYRRHLMSHGIHDAIDLSKSQLAELMGQRALRARYGGRVASLAESTSDFPALMLDAMNKSLRMMYRDAPRTWQRWAKRGVSPDFKNINRVALSDAPSMKSRNEGGGITYVKLTDSKETYALAEYVNGIILTRRAIINDDLGAFNAVPQLQAMSAGRLEDDVAYAVLTGNAAMSDTIVLFHASHGNYTSSGTAIGKSSLSVAKTLMKKQKGPNGARLELEMKILLVPTSIEEHAISYIGSEKLMPTQSSTNAAEVSQATNNPHYKRFEVIGSTRLDDDDNNAWYGLADYRDGQVDTIEVSFLLDEPEPVVRQETDFDTEDVKFACRHTCAAKGLDYRGVYMNEGA